MTERSRHVAQFEHDCNSPSIFPHIFWKTLQRQPALQDASSCVLHGKSARRKHMTTSSHVAFRLCPFWVMKFEFSPKKVTERKYQSYKYTAVSIFLHSMGWDF